MAKNNSLHSVGEIELIEKLLRVLSSDFPSGVIGPSDDCAVLPMSLFSPAAKGSLLLTTDSLVEGRHFRFDFMSPLQIGWKAMAVNLSDIAAMGGVPRFSLVSLELAPSLNLETVEEIYRGLNKCAAEYGVYVVGGNTTASQQNSLTITLLGFSELDPILRSGAKPGDSIWVSGSIGDSAAGLLILREEINANVLGEYAKHVLSRYCAPIPRVKLGIQLINSSMVSSMIDISDGLITECNHLAVKSGVAMEIDIAKVPIATQLKSSSEIPICALLTGGDDYELLSTASNTHDEKIESLSGRDSLPQLTKIGTVRKSSGELTYIKNADGRVLSEVDFFDSHNWTKGRGYEHFKTH